MSINSIYSSSSPYTSPVQPSTGMQQGKADFSALSQALSSGDLAGAQSAFASLQKDVPALAASSTSGSQNPVQSAIASVGQALSSGNLSAAQSAFAQVQGGHKGHHGHHHGGGAAPATAPAADAPTDLSPAASTFEASA